MIQQEINLNLIPSSEPVVVHCNQYDEGKSRIVAHLFNGVDPYTPSANATAKIQGTKPDNHGYQYWCELSGSTVTIDVNLQMTAAAGRVPSQVVINETTGFTGSFAFYLDVQKSTLPPSIDISDTDIPILTEEAQEAARRAVQASEAAAQSASDAALWSGNPPYIGTDNHWFVYDIITGQFIDTGIVARGQDGAAGTDGKDGSHWYRGTDISGKSITPQSYTTGIGKANIDDLYLNPTEGAVYHCVTGGNESTATWVYDFTLTGGGSGGVSDYNDLVNKPKINGHNLEGNKTITELGGVQSFNGRSGSILPIAGDYKSNQVVLSSVMHIGGETQRDVDQALSALEKEAQAAFERHYGMINTETEFLPNGNIISTNSDGVLTTVFGTSGGNKTITETLVSSGITYVKVTTIIPEGTGTNKTIREVYTKS